MNDQQILERIDRKLSALIALIALSITGEAKNAKLEIILRNTGLGVSDIAKVLNKQEGAIRKSIQRAK